MLDEAVDRLGRAAAFDELGKTLRSSGTWSVIWGLIAVVLGAATVDINPIKGVLVMLGATMVVVGLWGPRSALGGGLGRR